MNKKLFALLSILVLASMALAACGGSAAQAPESTEAPKEYINVAGGHPKTLDFLTGQQLSSDCPPWVSGTSESISFTPDLTVKESDYTCTADGKTLLITVSQVEPIPHLEKNATSVVIAGEENIVFIESAIPSGNTYFEFQGLQPWMIVDKMTGNHAGFVTVTPPIDTVGKTFTLTVNTTDYVNLSITETITMTVIVEPAEAPTATEAPAAACPAPGFVAYSAEDFDGWAVNGGTAVDDAIQMFNIRAQLAAVIAIRKVNASVDTPAQMVNFQTCPDGSLNTDWTGQ